MKTFRKLPVLPILVITLSTFGCGDRGTGTGVDEDSGPGSLSFNFADGLTTHTFSASGQVQMSQGGEPQFGTWAAGGRSPDDELVVAAFQARTAPRGDMTFLYVPNTNAPKTVAISQACMEIGGDCPLMYLILNAPLTGDDEVFDRFCFLMNGTVTVSALSSQRARGTFSGQGVCLDIEFQSPMMFSVNNGTFNVPIVQGFE